MDDVLHAVQDERARAADVQEALHPQEVLAACLEQHRQPDAERRPVELLVEDQRERTHVVRRVCAARERRLEVRRGLPGQQSASGRRRRTTTSRIGQRPGSGRADVLERVDLRPLDQVGLRHDEAGRRRRPAGATPARARAGACRSARRPSSRPSRARSDAERRARTRASRGSAPDRQGPSSRGRPGRSDGISPRWRRPRRSSSSSPRSPRIVQQTQPLPSRTVRSSTRRSRWWSIPTSPSSLTITAVSTQLRAREQPAEQGRLAAAEKAGQDGDRDPVRHRCAPGASPRAPGRAGRAAARRAPRRRARACRCR